MLPFEGGQRRDLVSIREEIESALSHGIEGITLLGGEPLAQAEGGAALGRVAHDHGLSLMVFTGYTLEEARELPDPAVAGLLAETDILVDGPYLREQPETRRRWIGSANQRIHFLSNRCRADDPRWLQPNTLEVRFRGGELTVNGFPAAKAVGLWKRPGVRRPPG
jgi:anaerobic ribonucleoside-triphosphate reductase activating protein